MQLQQAFSVVMICDKQSMKIICTARMSAKVVVKAVGDSWKYRENILPPPVCETTGVYTQILTP